MGRPDREPLSLLFCSRTPRLQSQKLTAARQADEAEAVADQQVGLARAAAFGNEEQDRTATTATIWKLTCAPTPTVVLQ